MPAALRGIQALSSELGRRRPAPRGPAADASDVVGSTGGPAADASDVVSSTVVGDVPGMYVKQEGETAPMDTIREDGNSRSNTAS